MVILSAVHSPSQATRYNYSSEEKYAFVEVRPCPECQVYIGLEFCDTTALKLWVCCITFKGAH